ncbi:CHRD domain-containing protein [Noviherbaspirillum cavernae]|uniref:CHRD domain-containing protein n=1 Tax=Noviherbaspirillum cavernae TaxID=2320862 RepID=A0A418WV60_9BURK|nr:CHRD domain-containing protein [Noviherbaspirillum cavernae]RJF96479.1 CHRD domain-containing protein [Noviherbaspirillum cavernae]
MRILKKNARAPLAIAVAVATLLGTACSSTYTPAWAGKMMGYDLTGSAEVPPVSTKATGKSTIKVGDDRAVTGGITIEGMTATAAHIHQGAKGANGPVVIPLTKSSDNAFTVPANTKMTDAQYAAFKAGNLYINVHSAANPNGEIRMQMKP